MEKLEGGYTIPTLEWGGSVHVLMTSFNST